MSRLALSSSALIIGCLPYFELKIPSFRQPIYRDVPEGHLPCAKRFRNFLCDFYNRGYEFHMINHLQQPFDFLYGKILQPSTKRLEKSLHVDRSLHTGSNFVFMVTHHLRGVTRSYTSHPDHVPSEDD